MTIRRIAWRMDQCVPVDIEIGHLTQKAPLGQRFYDTLGEVYIYVHNALGDLTFQQDIRCSVADTEFILIPDSQMGLARPVNDIGPDQFGMCRVMLNTHASTIRVLTDGETLQGVGDSSGPLELKQVFTEDTPNVTWDPSGRGTPDYPLKASVNVPSSIVNTTGDVIGDSVNVPIDLSPTFKTTVDNKANKMDTGSGTKLDLVDVYNTLSDTIDENYTEIQNLGRDKANKIIITQPEVTVWDLFSIGPSAFVAGQYINSGNIPWDASVILPIVQELVAIHLAHSIDTISKQINQPTAPDGSYDRIGIRFKSYLSMISGGSYRGNLLINKLEEFDICPAQLGSIPTITVSSSGSIAASRPSRPSYIETIIEVKPYSWDTENVNFDEYINETSCPNLVAYMRNFKVTPTIVKDLIDVETELGEAIDEARGVAHEESLENQNSIITLTANKANKIIEQTLPPTEFMSAYTFMLTGNFGDPDAPMILANNNTITMAESGLTFLQELQNYFISHNITNDDYTEWVWREGPIGEDEDEKFKYSIGFWQHKEEDNRWSYRIWSPINGDDFISSGGCMAYSDSWGSSLYGLTEVAEPAQLPKTFNAGQTGNIPIMEGNIETLELLEGMPTYKQFLQNINTVNTPLDTQVLDLLDVRNSLQAEITTNTTNIATLTTQVASKVSSVTADNGGHNVTITVGGTATAPIISADVFDNTIHPPVLFYTNPTSTNDDDGMIISKDLTITNLFDGTDEEFENLATYLTAILNDPTFYVAKYEIVDTLYFSIYTDPTDNFWLGFGNSIMSIRYNNSSETVERTGGPLILTRGIYNLSGDSSTGAPLRLLISFMKSLITRMVLSNGS